jgi:serine/threonine-protein kinase HipA
MQSLCGMAHYDFNQAGAYGYEQALQVIRRLGLPMAAVEEQFRRMVFNIVARNQDDHVKEHCFSDGPFGKLVALTRVRHDLQLSTGGTWTSSHQMTMNGKRSDFTLEDFKACARSASMKRGRAETIIAEVREVVARWRDYADESRVHPGSGTKYIPRPLSTTKTVPLLLQEYIVPRVSRRAASMPVYLPCLA